MKQIILNLPFQQIEPAYKNWKWYLGYFEYVCILKGDYFNFTKTKIY